MINKFISFDLLQNTIEASNGRSEPKWVGRYDKLKPILKAVMSDALTSRQRQVCILYFYNNLNIVEIAEYLMVNKSTVSRTLARALKNINDRIKYYA